MKNLTFIPAKDFFTLKVQKIHFAFFSFNKKVSQETLTLRCLINVRLLVFKVFFHQYLLNRDRAFIKFELIIAKTKYMRIFLQKLQYSEPNYWVFFFPVLLFGPVCLLFFQNLPPRTFIWTRTFIRHLRVCREMTTTVYPQFVDISKYGLF